MADLQEPSSSTTTQPDTQSKPVEDVSSEVESSESKPSPSSTTMTTDAKAAGEVTFSFNPSVSDDEIEKEDLEKIKGDVIGNTLYSERFVLSTVLKLTELEKDLSEDEPFEKDMCSLWNMTIESDVVKLLLSQVPEIFPTIIEKTE